MYVIEPQNAISLWWATSPDADRMVEHPARPGFQVEYGDPDSVARSITRLMHHLDTHRRFRQISIYDGTGFQHHCCTPVETCVNTHPDERQMITAVIQALDQLLSMESRYMSGWKIATEFLPVVVNRALHYDIEPPKGFKTNISRRFSTVDNYVDLSCVYSQGVGPSLRPLPSLADCLEYWNPGRRYLDVDQVLVLPGEQRLAAVEQILAAEHQVLYRYLGNKIVTTDEPESF
jgi:hypothetical protein